jgi:uroporphyrinogen decarboxylase
MHPHVERLPPPAPDYRRFLAALRRERPDRVPLLELAVHPEVVDKLLGDDAARTGADSRYDAACRAVRLQQRLGYDVTKISALIPFGLGRLQGTDPSTLSSSTREWADEHHGPIATRADFERYPWPTPETTDFGPVEAASAILPDGMRLVGFCGGVLEFSMDLLGMQNFLLATRRAPELVAAVIERVGQLIAGVFCRYCRYDAVAALWLGDDLGHKHGTLLAPTWLAAHIVPWYRRFADLAHAHGRPFLLHSCGNTAALMPDLVATGIDGKHSFEDVIQPVEQYYAAWHDRVAVLGGVDVHLLATGDAAAIRARTLDILQRCAPGGGYAAGSGNSIPNYVPAENYVAMIAAVHEYNRR